MLINAALYQVRTIGRTGLTMFRCCVRLRNACRKRNIIIGPVLVRRGSNEHPLSARLLDSRVVVLSLSNFRNSYKLDRSITAKNITDPRVGRPTNASERVEATETNKNMLQLLWITSAPGMKIAPAPSRQRKCGSSFGGRVVFLQLF